MKNFVTAVLLLFCATLVAQETNPKFKKEIVQQNLEIRLYHTNFVLSSNGHLASFDRDYGWTLNTKRIYDALSKMDGVKDFYIDKYRLEIIKAPLFEWGEIEPKVFELIRTIGREVSGKDPELISDLADNNTHN